MNIVEKNNKIYKYESVWRDKYNEKMTDSRGNEFPWPKANNKLWQNKKNFLEKLNNVEEYLKKNGKIQKYNKSKDCLLCDKKHITTHKFILNNVVWENGLNHYIDIHNIKPSEFFIDYIFRANTDRSNIHRVIGTIKGQKVIINKNKQFLKIDRNQILIMDALLKHGSYKIYTDTKHRDVYRYSEHFGLLDFNNNGLEKIIISGNTTRVDKDDKDIFLPKSMTDIFDYEYFFHTHPPTPKPGARAKVGILYEFPSVSDIFHFIDHYNEGRAQGSIVIAPEGMYVIRKKINDNLKLKINENKMYKEYDSAFWKAQDLSIKKYGYNFNLNIFYSKISQDTNYIDILNNILNKHELHIDYYSRIKDQRNRWIIDTVYLPVYVIEPHT